MARNGKPGAVFFRHFARIALRAVFAGMAAHLNPCRSKRRDQVHSAGVLMLSAHAAGWPVARGGSAADRRNMSVVFAIARGRDCDFLPREIACRITRRGRLCFAT